jgi:hypothetical protein
MFGGEALMRSVRQSGQLRQQRWRSGIALVAAVLLAGCGGDSGAAPEQPGADPAAIEVVGDDDEDRSGAYLKFNFDVSGDV